MNYKPVIIGAVILAAAFFLLRKDGIISDLLNGMPGGSAEGGGSSGYPDSPYYRLTDEQPPTWQPEPPAHDPTPAPTPDPSPGPTPPGYTEPAKIGKTNIIEQINPNRPSWIDTVDNIGTVALAAGGTAWAANELFKGGRGQKGIDFLKKTGGKVWESAKKIPESKTIGKVAVPAALATTLFLAASDNNPVVGDFLTNYVRKPLENFLENTIGLKRVKAATSDQKTPAQLTGQGKEFWNSSIAISGKTQNGTAVMAQPANPNRPSYHGTNIDSAISNLSPIIAAAIRGVPQPTSGKTTSGSGGYSVTYYPQGDPRSPTTKWIAMR